MERDTTFVSHDFDYNNFSDIYDRLSHFVMYSFNNENCNNFISYLSSFLEEKYKFSNINDIEGYEIFTIVNNLINKIINYNIIINNEVKDNFFDNIVLYVYYFFRDNKINKEKYQIVYNTLYYLIDLDIDLLADKLDKNFLFDLVIKFLNKIFLNNDINIHFIDNVFLNLCIFDKNKINNISNITNNFIKNSFNKENYILHIFQIYNKTDISKKSYQFIYNIIIAHQDIIKSNKECKEELGKLFFNLLYNINIQNEDFFCLIFNEYLKFFDNIEDKKSLILNILNKVNNFLNKLKIDYIPSKFILYLCNIEQNIFEQNNNIVNNSMLNILLIIKEYLTDKQNIKDIKNAISYYGRQIRYGERMFFLSKQSNEPLNEFFKCLELYFQIKIPNILIETTKSIEVAYDNRDNKQKYLSKLNFLNVLQNLDLKNKNTILCAFENNTIPVFMYGSVNITKEIEKKFDKSIFDDIINILNNKMIVVDIEKDANSVFYPILTLIKNTNINDKNILDKALQIDIENNNNNNNYLQQRKINYLYDDFTNNIVKLDKLKLECLFNVFNSVIKNTVYFIDTKNITTNINCIIKNNNMKNIQKITITLKNILNIKDEVISWQGLIKQHNNNSNILHFIP